MILTDEGKRRSGLLQHIQKVSRQRGKRPKWMKKVSHFAAWQPIPPFGPTVDKGEG